MQLRVVAGASPPALLWGAPRGWPTSPPMSPLDRPAPV
jgi:hypothetical protein